MSVSLCLSLIAHNSEWFQFISILTSKCSIFGKIAHHICCVSRERKKKRAWPFHFLNAYGKWSVHLRVLIGKYASMPTNLHQTYTHTHSFSRSLFRLVHVCTLYALCMCCCHSLLHFFYADQTNNCLHFISLMLCTT